LEAADLLLSPPLAGTAAAAPSALLIFLCLFLDYLDAVSVFAGQLLLAEG